MMSQAGNLLQLNQAFERCLPKAMQGRFQVNSLQHRLLTITCSSATFATRFRLIQPQVMKDLQQQHQLQFDKVLIKIRPAKFEAKRPGIERKLSKENARLLATEAEHTIDSKLKEILSKLASRGG